MQPNTVTNIIYGGMQLPPFQLGDTVRAGMAVAQIPDLKNWEVSANIGELDRGHLSTGQKVNIAVVALPGKQFPATSRLSAERQALPGTVTSNAASRSRSRRPSCARA